MKAMIAAFIFVCGVSTAGGQSVAWATYSPPVQTGCSFVCTTPDVNGDGYEDILAANTNWSIPAPAGMGWGGVYPGAGKVQVVSGKDGSIVREHFGTSSFESYFVDGWVGDVDGDHCCDYLISSALLGQRIVSGATGVVGPPVPVLSAYPSARGVGDVNGDGVGDFAVGNGGAVAVHSGSSATLLYTVYGWVGSGTVWRGFSIARMGDVDGDGVDDFVFGAPTPDSPQASSATGSASLVSGASGAVLSTITMPGIQTRFGRTVACLGDVSGDGISDFFVNAPALHMAWVFSGAAGTPLIYALTPSWVYPQYLGFAYYAAPVGDVDGDGWPDFVMTKEGGQLSIRSGPTGSEIGLVPQLSTHTLIGLGALRDLEGDGYGDLIQGYAPWNQPAPFNTTAFAAVSMIPNGLSISGTGCPGSTGTVPRIAGDRPPWAGGAFRVGLSDAVPGASSLLIVGTSATQWNGFSLPIDFAAQGLPGCQLMTSLDLVLTHWTYGANSGVGAATQLFQVPVGLAGATFFAQWAVESPPGGVPSIAMTPMLTTTVL